MSFNVPCPVCRSLVAPHAALCVTCDTALRDPYEDPTGNEGAEYVPRAVEGKRSCARCAEMIDVSAEACESCGRRVHNAYRNSARATILIVTLLFATAAVNQLVSRWRDLTTAGGANFAGVRPVDAAAIERGLTAAELRRTEQRRRFAEQLAAEYEQRAAGVALEASGDDLTVITFTSKVLTQRHVDKLLENGEVMSELRNLGFREVRFSDGRGKNWARELGGGREEGGGAELPTPFSITD